MNILRIKMEYNIQSQKIKTNALKNATSSNALKNARNYFKNLFIKQSNKIFN